MQNNNVDTKPTDEETSTSEASYTKGETDFDSRTAYASGSSVYIDIFVDPLQERYNVGETLSSIEANVRYANGSAIDGLSLRGKLSGMTDLSLDFAGLGNGKYRARLDYPITKGEGVFIDIKVNASFANGAVFSTVKKLILVPKDSNLLIIVQEPDRRSFASGQSVDFKVIFDAGGKNIEEGEIVLYEEWTNEKHTLVREGKTYQLTYDIPKAARSNIPLIIYGSARIDGKMVSTVKEISLDLIQ
jgi:hypothetical protein